MLSEILKPGGHSTEGEKHRQLDQEIRGVVSAITNRATELHNPGSSHQEEEDEDHGGASIITLAGTNHGSTMRGEMDETCGRTHMEETNWYLYLNDNFQAINNSLVLETYYKTNNPGVHTEVLDVFKHDRYGWKEKKNGKKKSLKSNQHSG
ncbi:hypothetical protein SLE2022_393870 [Rubroshorea leprosula]